MYRGRSEFETSILRYFCVLTEQMVRSTSAMLLAFLILFAQIDFLATPQAERLFATTHQLTQLFAKHHKGQVFDVAYIADEHNEDLLLLFRLLLAVIARDAFDACSTEATTNPRRRAAVSVVLSCLEFVFPLLSKSIFEVCALYCFPTHYHSCLLASGILRGVLPTRRSDDAELYGRLARE